MASIVIFGENAKPREPFCNPMTAVRKSRNRLSKKKPQFLPQLLDLTKRVTNALVNTPGNPQGAGDHVETKASKVL